MRIVRRGPVWAQVADGEPGWSEFWDLYERGAWESVTTAIMDDLLSKGGIFVDVGAWIGPLTIYAAALGARVIAAEPDDVAYQALIDMVQTNALDVQPMRVAVVPVERECYLAHGPGGEYGDSMSRIAEDGRPVRGVTMARVLEYATVDVRDVSFVKVDVEGFETELMPQLGPWLAEYRIPVLVALHDTEADDAWFGGYENVIRGEDFVLAR